MPKELMNKPVVGEVRRLKINKTATAKQLGISVKTLNKRLRGELPKKRETNKVSIIEPYKEIINDKLDKYIVTSAALYHFIKKEHNYPGSYETVKNYVNLHRKKRNEEAFIRVIRNPGLQAQVDWKEEKKMVNKNSEVFEFNIFTYVLCYSQFRYYEITTDRKQSTLFQCLINAFKASGGIPQEIWFDNMKTVVNRHYSETGVVEFESKFLQFSKDMSFTPIACRNYRPQTKGMVEGAVKLTNRLDPYNNEFNTFDELKKIMEEINNEVNNEINSTTGKTAIELQKSEKDCLNPVPDCSFTTSYLSKETRKVTNESMISFKECKYSVPIEYIGKNVEISTENDSLNIYYNSKLIRIHTITTKKLNYNEDDYKEIITNSIECKGKTDVEREAVLKNRMEDYDKLYKNK